MTRRDRAVLARGRVFVCHPAPQDEANFVAAMKRSRKLHKSYTRAPRSAEEYRHFLKRFESERSYCSMICRRDTEEIVGVINLSEIVHGGFKSTYLGYYAVAGQDGKGFMTEGMNLTLRFAFHHLGLHRAEANIQPDNERSLRLVQRVGFRKEGFSPRYLKIGGQWRDHERWAILREDWEALQKSSAKTRKAKSRT